MTEPAAPHGATSTLPLAAALLLGAIAGAGAPPQRMTQ